MAAPLKSFPKIAAPNWWKLRDLFNRKVPSVVTASYLANALEMKEASARANILAPFKKIGIIDGEGKPTDLAYDWRDDEKYPSVCQSILKARYPQEVRDLYPDKDQDLAGLVPWFQNHCRCGEPAAKMFSDFYRLLLRADPTEQTQAQSQAGTPKRKRTKENAQKTVQKDQPEPAPLEGSAIVGSTRSEGVAPIKLSAAPQIHVNIQLHISPETTADQIDKIFESMAKHLKSLSKMDV